MKGITTYSLSQNRQRPTAGMLYNAFFNTYRRSKAQILYVLPPFIAAYALMDWATKKNEYLMSKPGRLATAGDEE
ncbi:Cytochrome b-c1 complex subunit 8, mitochondrial [Microsporum ferrugineum]